MKTRRYRAIAGLFSLYVFFCTLVVSLLFITGNMQSFLESTNRLLLDILEWLLFIFLITNMYYIAFYVAEYTGHPRGSRKITKKMGILWSAGGFAFGAVYLLLINAIVAWL